MGEIDDEYQEKVDSLDQEFFESFKKGKSGQDIVPKYREQLEKHRKDFEKHYTKQLEKEKAALRKSKKEPQKKEVFKTLEVSHFDFTFSRKERFIMKWKFFWFKVSRMYHRLLSAVLPSKGIYWYYKGILFLKGFWRGIVHFVEYLLISLEHAVIVLFKNSWKGMWKLWKLLLWPFRRIFSKKASSKEKEEKGKEKSEEGKEDTEPKTEEKNNEEDDKGG